MICPLCHFAPILLRHKQVPDFDYGLPFKMDFYECAACASLTEFPILSRQELQIAYPPQYQSERNGGAVGFLKWIQARWLARKIDRTLHAKSGAVLEVGCGSGQLLRALEARGYGSLKGIDYGGIPAASDSRVEYLAGNLETMTDLGPSPFEAILMIHVVEHLTNPEAFLKIAFAALCPGGRIVIITPNSRAWSHKIFGKYWAGLHTPRHTHIFSPHSLLKLGQKLGAHVELEQLLDPASWAISFQHFVESKLKRTGMRWICLASLPIWLPFAWAEKKCRISSSIFVVMRKI